MNDRRKNDAEQTTAPEAYSKFRSTSTKRLKSSKPEEYHQQLTSFIGGHRGWCNCLLQLCSGADYTPAVGLILATKAFLVNNCDGGTGMKKRDHLTTILPGNTKTPLSTIE